MWTAKAWYVRLQLFDTNINNWVSQQTNTVQLEGQKTKILTREQSVDVEWLHKCVHKGIDSRRSRLFYAWWKKVPSIKCSKMGKKAVSILLLSSNVVMQQKAQGSNFWWASCYLVTRLKAKTRLLMSKVSSCNDARSREWSAPPNTQWKSTDVTTKIRGGSKALQIYEGRIKEKLVHPLRRYLYKSACFFVILIWSSSPQEFFMGTRAGGNMKSSCARI